MEARNWHASQLSCYNYGGENFSSRNPSARNYSVPGEMRSNQPNSVMAKLKLAQPDPVMWSFQCPERDKISISSLNNRLHLLWTPTVLAHVLAALVHEPRKSQDGCLNIWIKNANLNQSTCTNPHWHLSLSSQDFHVSSPIFMPEQNSPSLARCIQ